MNTQFDAEMMAKLEDIYNKWLNHVKTEFTQVEFVGHLASGHLKGEFIGKLKKKAEELL